MTRGDVFFGAVVVAVAVTVNPASSLAVVIPCQGDGGDEAALIAAIETANGNGPGADTIELAEGCVYAFTSPYSSRTPSTTSGMGRRRYPRSPRRSPSTATARRSSGSSHQCSRSGCSSSGPTRLIRHLRLRKPRRGRTDTEGPHPQGRPGQGRQRGGGLQRRRRRRGHGRCDLQPGQRHPRTGDDRRQHRPGRQRRQRAAASEGDFPAAAAAEAATGRRSARQRRWLRRGFGFGGFGGFGGGSGFHQRRGRGRRGFRATDDAVGRRRRTAADPSTGIGGAGGLTPGNRRGRQRQRRRR